ELRQTNLPGCRAVGGHAALGADAHLVCCILVAAAAADHEYQDTQQASHAHLHGISEQLDSRRSLTLSRLRSPTAHLYCRAIRRHESVTEYQVKPKHGQTEVKVKRKKKGRWK